MADLITLEQLTDRLGSSFSVDTVQATAYITDASALVRKAADGNLDDVDHTTPPPDAIVPVVVSAVRRALVNPDGAGSESIGDYRTGGLPQDGVFLTKKERSEIRSYYGILSVGSIPLNADIPTPKTETVPEEEVGWVPL